MLTEDILIQIQADIAEVKKHLQKSSPTITVSDKWLPRSAVRKFLNYGETQMCALEKKGGLIVSRVGKRKFILRDSIAKLLDDNIVISTC